MIPERTLVKISATFTIGLVAILVFNNLEPSEPTETITIHLCQLQDQQPEPIQNKVLAFNNRTLVNFVAHLKYVRRYDITINDDDDDDENKQSNSYNRARQTIRDAEDADEEEQKDEDSKRQQQGKYEETKYLPLKLFFVQHSIIDEDNQDLYLICMCAAFKISLTRVDKQTWTTTGLPQDASTYIHSRKQEYRDFYMDLEFDPERRRFHCDRPWQVPILNLARQSVDQIVEPYDEITLNIEQLDLEFNGGPMMLEKVFTKPIQECSTPRKLVTRYFL